MSELSNKQIEKIKNYSLSGNDIMKFMNGKAKIVLYSDIHKYQSLDQLLYPYDCCFILYLTSDNYGHWCCVFKYPEINEIEFFDPYGIIIDDQLLYINSKFRDRSKQNFPYLSKLIYYSPYLINYNNYKFQKKGDGINTCGRWCIVRILCKNLNIEEFKKLFKRKNSDDLVSILTSQINK